MNPEEGICRGCVFVFPFDLIAAGFDLCNGNKFRKNLQLSARIGIRTMAMSVKQRLQCMIHFVQGDKNRLIGSGSPGCYHHGWPSFRPCFQQASFIFGPGFAGVFVRQVELYAGDPALILHQGCFDGFAEPGAVCAASFDIFVCVDLNFHGL
jgi:hypothetical protein